MKVTPALSRSNVIDAIPDDQIPVTDRELHLARSSGCLDPDSLPLGRPHFRPLVLIDEVELDTVNVQAFLLACVDSRRPFTVLLSS